MGTSWEAVLILFLFVLPCCLLKWDAGREDEAVDVKRDVREELAEQRKQLKELLDAGGWDTMSNVYFPYA
jgi:hypothetical protein